MERFRPPFCPNPACPHHRRSAVPWHWIRAGRYARLAAPQRIQRFQCRHCRRHFSTQTFSTTYWLRRPELLEPTCHRLLGCSALRQIAREFHASPQTILGLAVRLGRHALLVHLALRPRTPAHEPLALDSFQSFEFSHDHPTLFHVLAGRRSHFFYGFTDSELRRSGRMTPAQRHRRAARERRTGRPHPRAIELDVAALLAAVAPQPAALTLHTDRHHDYPRALRRLPHLAVAHHTVSSRAARTPRNPLFEVNLLDLLIRHCGANHKRETIAFSKRRQAAAERLWLFLAWRNYVKRFSERRRDPTPAMRLGLTDHPWTVRELLTPRRFAAHVPWPEPWRRYYARAVLTRAFPRQDPVARTFVA